jgi:hypothetical protein
MRRKLLVILILLILILGYAFLLRPSFVLHLYPPWGHRDVVERVFRDQEIFDAVMNSPQVTVQRLHWNSDLDQDRLSSYTRDAALTLTDAQAQQIKSLLKKPSSYLWDVASCGPVYGVLYNFQSGGHAVHVAFCFKCNIIGIFDGDNDSSNRVNATPQFDPMRGPMVTLSKALFPTDKEIQGLK